MNLNVIIPLAGDGLRFKKDYPDTPKPLIKINDFTMIEVAIKSLNIKDADFYFIKKKYDNELYNLKLEKILLKWTEKEKVFTIDKAFYGPVYTCLLIEQNIDQELPLIITNCDQFTKWNPKIFFDFVNKTKMDGCVVTYKSNEEKNSYAHVENGLVTEIVEKQVISNCALVGIHYWKKTKYFFDSAKTLINEIENFNNRKEAFISETYNFLIKKGMKINNFNLNRNEFDLIGTPKDLEKFRKKYKYILLSQ